MVTNGYVVGSHLTTVFPGARLLTPVAISVRTLVLVGALEGVRVTAAGKYASGYRNAADQKLFLDASRGNTAAIRTLRSRGTVIDPHMSTRVGNVGAQSHGWADRIDLLFNGASPDGPDLALAARYGGRQEFGNDDRNHFQFAPNHAGVAESDKNRVVAAFLNEHNLGRATDTDKDGQWPAKSNYSWLLQEYGTRKPGWYTPGVYKHDGERGPRTVWIRDKIWGQLWAA